MVVAYQLKTSDVRIHPTATTRAETLVTPPLVACWREPHQDEHDADHERRRTDPSREEDRDAAGQPDRSAISEPGCSVTIARPSAVAVTSARPKERIIRRTKGRFSSAPYTRFNAPMIARMAPDTSHTASPTRASARSRSRSRGPPERSR